MTASKKLTPKQVAQLGGLAAARVAGPEGVRRRSMKGGNSTLDKYGKEFYVRLAHMKHGRLKGGSPIPKSPSDENQP